MARSDESGIPERIAIGHHADGRPIWPIAGGDGEGDDDDTGGAPPAGDPPAPPANLSLTPEQIRNSPEFRAQARENRKLARQLGEAQTAAAAARTEAEGARQAAEAKQQADLVAELTATLGDEGVADYNELVELAATDPTAAARKMAALIAQARVQSPAPGSPPPAPPAPATGAPVVPGTPPPPSGLGADAPLGAPPAAADPNAQLIADLEGTFGSVVERVANPETRRRVTAKDRAAAAIGYIGAAVLKAGAKHTTNS